MSEPWQGASDAVRRMQHVLDQARTAAAGDAGQSEQMTGSAETMRGMVRVEVTGQRVSDVSIDPRAMHRTAEDLAAAVREATNAAFDDLRSAMVEDVPSAPPLDEVSRTLNEVSTDSLRALRDAQEGVRRSMAAIQRISEQHRGTGQG